MTDNPTFQFFNDHFTFFFYGCYLVLFCLISIWEYFAPRRPLTHSRLGRWTKNFFLYLITAVIIQSLSTLTITNLAYYTWKNGWGLLNILPISPLVRFFLTLILLDLMVYLLHVFNHKVHFGWRFHRVHHTDLDLDSTSGVLFHPLEGLFSFFIRQPFVLLVGPSPEAIFVFDVFFLMVLLLTHANVRVHPLIDRAFRWVFVTPDMHRIHHSVDWDESNSNYGFSLSGWDRLFKTYRGQSGIPPEKMKLGLKEFQTPEDLKMVRILALPFLKKREWPK